MMLNIWNQNLWNHKSEIYVGIKMCDYNGQHFTMPLTLTKQEFHKAHVSPWKRISITGSPVNQNSTESQAEKLCCKCSKVGLELDSVAVSVKHGTWHD